MDLEILDQRGKSSTGSDLLKADDVRSGRNSRILQPVNTNDIQGQIQFFECHLLDVQNIQKFIFSAIFLVPLPLGGKSLWLDPLEPCVGLLLVQCPAECLRAGNMGRVLDIQRECSVL